jgi:hypothetical protein
MILSTDLPCGGKAVREYLNARGDSRLPANVPRYSGEQISDAAEGKASAWIQACGGKAPTVPRKFKVCKQCGTRFLAVRANQDFHAEKCKKRWHRANPLLTRGIGVLLPSESDLRAGLNGTICDENGVAK